MALDPSIILRNIAPQVDIGGQVRSGLKTAGIFAKLRQKEEEAPIRQAILQNQSNLLAQQVATGAAEEQEATRKRDLKGLGSSYLQVQGDIAAGNFNSAADQLQVIYDQKIAAGQTPEDMLAHAQAIETLRSNDAEAIKDLKALGQGAIDVAVAEGLLEDPAAAKVKTTPAAVREVKGLIKLSESENPDEAKAAKVALGLLAKEGTLTKAERLAEDPELTGKVAKSQAEIEGEKAAAKETAKLSTQLKLEPAVKSAVATAVAKAKATVDALGTKRDNQIALRVYNTAMGGLAESLGGTVTGPLLGRAPAFTANQQIADGAVAAMAPVLKQLFRGASEGTFTDQDQKLLLDMVPTRKDEPEARIAKIQNIDAIVKAKLSVPQETGEQQQTEAPTGDLGGLSDADLLEGF